jgi:hypothetical protein
MQPLEPAPQHIQNSSHQKNSPVAGTWQMAWTKSTQGLWQRTHNSQQRNARAMLANTTCPTATRNNVTCTSGSGRWVLHIHFARTWDDNCTCTPVP